MDALSNIRTRESVTTTPQRRPANNREVRNNAGGYVYQVSDAIKINRFLTLGTEGGTYYQNAPELTKENATTVLAAARDNGEWLVDVIVSISESGRAPRQNPAVFALAAVAGLGSLDARRKALNALPTVCRTGSTMLMFLGYVEQFRGWGRGLRTGVQNWCAAQDVDRLAYQFVKYRQRDGWAQRDLLRLAHPSGTGPTDALYHWVAKGALLPDAPKIVQAHVEAMTSTRESVWTRLIMQHGLTWEMLPDAALTNPNVWRTMIQKGMPQTALMRQLPRLTRLGVLEGEIETIVARQLQDNERLANGRVHPVNVLVAHRTYAQGMSFRGSSTWTPKRRIIDALDAAFYNAYASVEPAGKRTMVALDVSGSMAARIGETPLSSREASAALALVLMATEPDTIVTGFTASGRGRLGGWGMRDAAIQELGISPRQRLNDAIRDVSNLPFGATDCSLPMQWAQQQGRAFDTFVVLTDNETWHGEMHPMEALRRYRASAGIDAKLIVIATTASRFSIADPNDDGALDVSGFDSNVPALVSNFSRGSL